MRPRLGHVLVAGATSLGLMIGAFLLGMNIRTSEQEAFDNSQVQVSALSTVVLRSPSGLVTSGRAVGGSETIVVAATPPGARVAQVTNGPMAAGTPVHAGDVLAAVSNRPVIAWPLEGPTYRDLVLYDTGPDVLAVNRALATMGFEVDAASSDFGWSTSEAIAELYESRGFEALRAERPPDPAAPPAIPQTLPQGSSLPYSEVASIPAGDLVISRAAAPLELLAEGEEVVVVSAVVEEVEGRLSALEVRRIAVGQKVTVIAQGSGEKFDGLVAAIGAFSEAPQSEEGVPTGIPGYDVRVAVEPARASSLADGQAVTLEFSQKGDPTLAVPATAIQQDGSVTSVWRKSRVGFDEVVVEVEMISDGWAYLSKVNGLDPGDSVRLG